MVRGAIENVTRNRVFGWLWSPDASVRGRTVLAFLDDVCIGSGKVDGFRQDLKDAGLGDGYAGFNFNLTFPNAGDAPRVTVKLDGSDAMLVQRTSRIVPPGGAAGGPAAGRLEPSLSSLQWMRGRGWLSQSDFDFLRFFRQFGVYERSLVVPKERGGDGMQGAPVLLDPAETAEALLGLTRFDESVMTREKVSTVRDLRRMADQVGKANGPGAVIALWSSTKRRLPVVEGSHTSQAETPEEKPVGTEYGLGPDRLLFLDTRIVLGTEASMPASGVEVFHLSP